MGGSSSGGYSGRPSRPIRLTLSDAEINGCLRDLLRDYNDRDTQAISRHLQVLRDSLEIRDDDVIRTLFGGSVSKHTAVNGLSDVDVLVIVNDSSLSGQSPAAVIKQMAERIRQRLPQTKVSTGALALDFTQNPGKVMDDITFVRSHWWLVSEGFSLSTANSDVQKLPATLYHRIADSLAYAA